MYIHTCRMSNYAVLCMYMNTYRIAFSNALFSLKNITCFKSPEFSLLKENNLIYFCDGKLMKLFSNFSGIFQFKRMHLIYLRKLSDLWLYVYFFHNH